MVNPAVSDDHVAIEVLMTTNPPQPHQTNPQFRCDPQQHALLVQCAKIQNVGQWNDWRAANPETEIWLEGSTAPGMAPEGAIFQFMNLSGVNLNNAHLAGAHFYQAKLQDANISFADLRGADLRGANLRGATLHGVNLCGADARAGNFENVKACGFHPYVAHFEGTSFLGAKFRGANLSNSHLEGADLSDCDLSGTIAYCVAVDGGTTIWNCSIDKDTDFTGVGLDSARVEPGLKDSLQYNIRKRRWCDWYRQGSWWRRTLKRAFVQSFWWVSDYGRSTGHILWLFLGTALLFAAVYYISHLFCSPGIIANLAEADGVQVPPLVIPIRAVYLSIASMAGLGELKPNVHYTLSHVLTTIHVVVGYILLAALVTRLAILFTSSGPTCRSGKQPRQPI